MWLRKQIFGIKSEKRLPLNPVDLMPSLFDALLTDEQERALQVEAQRLNSEIEEAIEVEKHIRKKRDKNRTLDAYSILQLFEKWLIDNSTKVLPSSPIGKAINYSYTLLPRLSRYVINGKYNIDNNLAESVIRPLAVGRKNWLHAGSTASATRTAMMYSFICSCKAVNVEPHLWFRYVIDNIGLYEQGKIEINELLPCNFDKRKSI